MNERGHSAWQVSRWALRIGRDHIASTVYTLVLAYTGAALPVLLLFTLSGCSVCDVLTGDEVGKEILRSLVGASGFAVAVPITTALAAFVVTAGSSIRTARLPAESPAGHAAILTRRSCDRTPDC